MSGKKAVDVISVCDAEGEILPLRMQMIDDERQLLRVHIQNAYVTERIRHIGAESVIFNCQAQVYDRVLSFRLQYTYRSHIWHLL